MRKELRVINGGTRRLLPERRFSISLDRAFNFLCLGVAAAALAYSAWLTNQFEQSVGTLRISVSGLERCVEEAWTHSREISRLFGDF